MSEYSDNLFSQDNERREAPRETTYTNGVCSRCMGTGYIIEVRNGLIGVLYTSTYEDEEGQDVKRLMVCDCKISVDY